MSALDKERKTRSSNSQNKVSSNKFAEKVTAIKRSKKILQGLYEILVPGWTIFKDDGVIYFIMDWTNIQRESDEAKFESQAKKDTAVSNYVVRRQKSNLWENNRGQNCKKRYINFGAALESAQQRQNRQATQYYRALLF